MSEKHPAEPQSPAAWLLTFLFSTMRDDVRGLLGLAFLAGAVILTAVGGYFWALVAGILGLTLLAVNGRHSRRGKDGRGERL